LKFGPDVAYPPPRYLLYKAARYCNTTPWIMEQMGQKYVNEALAFESAENEAKAYLHEKALRSAS